MADLSQLPRDYYVKAMAFTRNTFQDVYPSIDPAQPELSLAGEVAIITGASRGIGAKGMVPSFIKAGVRGLALLATNKEKLDAIKEEARAVNPNIEIVAVALDICNVGEVEAAFSEIKRKFQSARVLVNCAGMCSGDGPDIMDADPELWWRNFEVNGKGAFLLTRSFLRLQGDKDSHATIVNVSSWQGFYVVPPMSGYFISKFIGDSLMTYIAEQHKNVNAVAVYPGLVETDMLREPFRSLFSLDTAELVGGVAVWLCQEKARFLSGRFIAANWSVDDLLEKKEEILKNDLLKVKLSGQFGMDSV
ncbi:hypothetical protein JX266_012354 [Neoarthrinium moseri]|nr:hypothetical protein JX266_012354 [Neoarthrinium moseri]